MFVFLLSGFSTADGQRRRRKKVKPAPAPVVVAPPSVDYTVSMSKPATHLLEVEMKMTWDAMPDQPEIKMAVWTPGSYLIREYARHVQNFVALDGAGNSLDWRKTNKNTWQVDAKGAKEIRVGYDVYANDLTVRTNELNYEHAFFTPAALMMYPKGQLGAASTVKIKPHGNWKVATGLKSTGDNTFVSPNYDILFDSPFEVSNFKEKKFMVRGIPHRYVVTGEGNYDLDKIAEDTTKIIEQSYAIFGELPYDDYTFILNLRGGGGLEHLNSTALQWNRFGFGPQFYNRFLGLVAHEYFHLFNVKRMRPDPLGPFDYENENYTKLLWVAEGGTSYYEWVMMRRAGIFDAAAVLGNYARIAESLQKQPGRFQTSLEEASFDAWIKSYRPDENSVNRQISYYSKGELVNFLLDIQIQAASNGEKNMDDVMRHIYAENFEKGKTFTPADFQKACELMAGRSLEDFFSKYVSGRDEIAYDELLMPMGLKMVQLKPESNLPYHGANLRAGTGGVTVSSLPAGTPAYGSELNSGDLIIAVDGYQTTGTSQLNSHLNRKTAGDTVKLTVFRHSKLREIDLKLGKTPASRYAIKRVENPTEAQKALYKGFLLDDLDQLK
jgi:predicted metalloprotease with PDZ domain